LQEWRRDVLGKINALCVHMLNKIEHGRDARAKQHFAFYVSCDAFLAGIVLNRDMAKNVTPWHANIELHGQWTRGQIVLDYLLSHKPNINLIHDFDSELFKETLMRAMDVFKTAGDYTVCSDD
jgi:inosine-uridine nucleoside N-ribohydrolase